METLVNLFWLTVFMTFCATPVLLAVLLLKVLDNPKVSKVLVPAAKWCERKILSTLAWTVVAVLALAFVVFALRGMYSLLTMGPIGIVILLLGYIAFSMPTRSQG
jgi:FtsH-binding integral membrane protein